MANTARFWDWIAQRYARQPVADEAAYERKLEITRSYLRADMTVLEFGCGTGSTALAHAPHVAHILATDISRNMIAIAREKAKRAGVANVTFRQANIDTLEASDGAFNAVMGHSILHLVDDRNAVIARVHRLLKPGGVFVSSTACLGDSALKYIGFAMAPLARLTGLLPLVKAFTVRELVDSLTGAGFKIDHEWQPGDGKAVFIVARKTPA